MIEFLLNTWDILWYTVSLFRSIKNFISKILFRTQKLVLKTLVGFIYLIRWLLLIRTRSNLCTRMSRRWRCWRGWPRPPPAQSFCWRPASCSDWQRCWSSRQGQVPIRNTNSKSYLLFLNDINKVFIKMFLNADMLNI